MPSLSIITVFHRDTPFFREALASALGQTLQDVEVVLVDNGTGVSPDVLGSQGLDPRLRWVRLPKNQGIPAGHNAGVAASSSEYIMLLDYDDIALPDRAERQLAIMRQNPALGLVNCRAERINECGLVLGNEFSLMGADAQRTYTAYASPVVTPAYAGRREVFLEFPYREEFPFAADYDFLTRAAERWAMSSAPCTLLRYRWHSEQTTQQKSSEMEHSFCVVRLMTARRRGGRPEGLEAAFVAVGDRTQTPGESCRRTATACLREGFPLLAAYHARRSYVLDRTTRSLARALFIARSSLRVAAADRRLCLRMFLRGPVKAHGLKPA